MTTPDAPQAPRRVLLLVDVDGVLSPTAATNPAHRGPWWADPSFARAWGLPVWFSPTLVTSLNALTGLPHVTAHWLTSWEDAAADQFAPVVGLDARTWPVRVRRDEGPHRWWKAAEAADALAETEPTGDLVVWLDDDIDGWAAENTTNPAAVNLLTHPRLLAVCPDPATGLTQADLVALTNALLPTV